MKSQDLIQEAREISRAAKALKRDLSSLEAKCLRLSRWVKKAIDENEQNTEEAVAAEKRRQEIAHYQHPEDQPGI